MVGLRGIDYGDRYSQNIEELLSGKRVIINELIEKVEELNSISSLRDSDNTKEIIYNIGMWKN